MLNLLNNMETEKNFSSDFNSLKLKVASPDDILSWSHGEVTKPETINYRTQRPEKDGLFCERIFGPEKDWECYCGKYRRIRYKGIVCDKCGVEVTKSSVRRERMGHINLVVPVSHIWFLRGVPSKMGLVLGLSVQDLERVVYFASYIITKVDEEARQQAIEEVEKEFKLKSKEQSKEEKDNLKGQKDTAVKELRSLQPMQVLSEVQYRELSLRHGHVFEAGIGAEVIHRIFKDIDLETLSKNLKEQLLEASPVNKKKIQKRLRLIEGMIRSGIRPEWMFLTSLPVLPPDLRPMVQLDGGRYATSDVNDLYRRIINRNNRLKRLIDLNAPEVICRNEKRMLQEAVDALIDNSARRGQTAVAASTGQKRALRSLADMLKGKKGRFRQNLLGKRVDYSGRSVIVVGPDLKLSQCGLPKYMALELFKPFIINKLVERELAHNVRGAGHLIEQETDDVWAILEEVVKGCCVLLNRAPTLHRLGIQAFEPVLIEGHAIQVHPIVCRAFNADFDGDQMAVHLPLSKKAQEEAREIMLSAKNLLKPSTGDPVAVPTQDIVLGCYWMTKLVDGLKGEDKIFGSPDEALLAKHFDVVDLHTKIKLRLPDNQFVKDEELPENRLIETSVGRIIFNEAIPEEFGFINKVMVSKELRGLVSDLVEKIGVDDTAIVLDKIKRMGFKYATDSGITWGMADLNIPAGKAKLIKEADQKLESIQKQYLDGLLTESERKAKAIEVWTEVNDQVFEEVKNTLDADKKNPVHDIVYSGARGSWNQIGQMMGMKGLVVNPAGDIMELPVKSSFKEGFDVLEYFISTHGTRKGTADTALRTATAGYLTRRLVDVAQDVVIREENCGDKKGIIVYRDDEKDIGHTLGSRVVGRSSLQQVKAVNAETKKEEVIIKSGQLITKEMARKIDEADIDQLRVRSVITCQSTTGVCQKCYGYDLGTNKLVKLGEAVGTVTAQAIGEPGTQLTMRTFHTGGVAGGSDITQGLPRVEEIFEARSPRWKAIVSEFDGKVLDVEEKEGQKHVRIEIQDEAIGKTKNKKETKEYIIPRGTGIWVKKGDLIAAGQQLSEGHVDLKELYNNADQEAVQRYVIKEVQNIYTTQGENISDKHIELIVRQMFSRVKVKEAGSTSLLDGQVVERNRFVEENKKAQKKGGDVATAQPLLMGITKVSLSTESFLSAASFQETARVLIDAAIQGKTDHLKGLKENVIIGKLIPAGTGFNPKAS